MGRVVRHAAAGNPFTRRPSPLERVELFFPIDEQTADEYAPTMSASFQRLVCADAGTVLTDYQRLWAEPGVSKLRKLRDQLSKYAPVSLLECKGDWWLRCVRGNPDEYVAGDELYFANRGNLDDVNEILDDFELKNDRAFLYFYLQYAGLRESMPPASGHFASGDLQLVCDSPLEERIDEDDLDFWADAICSYYARNGDVLMLDEAGESAWFVLETGEIRPFAASFSDLIAKWVDILDQAKRPIDSFTCLEY